MKAQKKGAIVNIASISGLRASTLRVAYGTSKAAIIHLTKQYAVELGNFGVRVNAVCPRPRGDRDGETRGDASMFNTRIESLLLVPLPSRR